MRSFGKQPPRALGSFGVSGLLGDECRVFYENLFSTRHVGRVGDLLAAKLKSAAPDELRLRALVAYATHEAFSLGGNPEGKAPVPVTAVAPVSFECGIDSEKIAVGLAFVRAATIPFDTSGLADRIKANRPKGQIETLLSWLFQHADRLVIRHQPSNRRMEIVALVGLPGKIDAESMAGPHDVEVVSFEQSPPRPPKAASYLQLGDLDYHRLLGDDGPGRGQTVTSLGEILAASPVVESGLPKTLAKAQAEVSTEDQRIAGGSGVRTDAITVVSGSNAKSDDSMIKISGGNLPDLQAGSLNANDALRYNLRISELQRRVMQLESELNMAQKMTVAGGAGSGANAPMGIEDLEGAKPAGGGGSSWFDRLLGKGGAAPAGAASASVPEEKTTGASDSLTAEDLMGAQIMNDILGGDDGASLGLESAPVAAAAVTEGVVEDALLKELGGDVEKSIQVAGQNVNELKKELNSPRAKRLLDGIMGELVAERSKVQDIAKKLNVTIRQKEIEFRNKNQSLTEELRRNGEQLKQRTFALTRSKEQLTQALILVEKLRQQSGGTGEDGAAYKQKFTQQQKILTSVKEENMSLATKVEELKSLLNAEKQAAKSRGPSFADFSGLQTRFERAQRQADEFKRTNQQLLDRLSEQRKDRGADGASVDEMRKRLEAATKMVAVNRKDQERLNQKIEEMRKEELRLKGDLNRAIMEVKRAKSAGYGSTATQAMGVPTKKDSGSSGTGGSGTGGGQAA